MNVNCKVSLTDEQRNKMFRKLNSSDGKGMVSRADVNVFVQEKIAECLMNGATLPKVEAEEITPDRVVKDMDDLVENFKPSRGDEPYIFKAKNETLREIHTRMLNVLEEYEAAVWADMEKNRI